MAPAMPCRFRPAALVARLGVLGVLGVLGAVAFLLASALPLSAASPLGPPPPRLVFEAPSSLGPVAARLRALGPGNLAAAMRLVGLTEPGPPVRVVLAREDSDLARNVPPWIAGYALGDLGVVVLLPGRQPSYPESSLAELLDHEVAHVLIARAAGGRPLPRFWNEGLAMAAAGDWGLEDRSRLALASLRGRDLSLGELDRLFAGGPGEVAAAYALSFAFVEDVLSREGQGTPAAILAGVAHGLSFEEAFRQAVGKTFDVAAADFTQRETFWYRWLPLLTSSVTLWIGITLLALWAGGRRRARTAALHRRWDEEEAERLARAAVPVFPLGEESLVEISGPLDPGDPGDPGEPVN
jgi:hypothetical protein